MQGISDCCVMFKYINEESIVFFTEASGSIEQIGQSKD